MAALEGSSTHPIAQSIVSAAKPLKNLKVEAVENIPILSIIMCKHSSRVEEC